MARNLIDGRFLYDTYKAACGGVSKFTGDKLPEWDDVDLDVRGFWDTTARHTNVRVGLADDIPEFPEKFSSYTIEEGEKFEVFLDVAWTGSCADIKYSIKEALLPGIEHDEDNNILRGIFPHSGTWHLTVTATNVDTGNVAHCCAIINVYKDMPLGSDHA